jgi:hypothetical protein
VPRPRNREEAGHRTVGEPGELRSRRQHLRDRRTVAAERGELDAPAPRREDGVRGVARVVDQGSRLLVSATPEAVRRRAALPVAALHEPRADLGRDETLALEHADGVAAEADEQDGDEVVLSERVEQRRELDRVVLTQMAEPEGGPDDERLAVRLDLRRAAGVARPAGRPGEGRETLADVFASDVSGQDGLPASGRGSRIVNAVPAPGALATSTSPSIACVNSRTIASPTPVPTARSPLYRR